MMYWQVFMVLSIGFDRLPTVGTDGFASLRFLSVADSGFRSVSFRWLPIGFRQ